MKKRIEAVTVYGIDIGKNTFHVVGLDNPGKPLLHSDKMLQLRVLLLHRCEEEALKRAEMRLRKQAAHLGFRIIPAEEG